MSVDEPAAGAIPPELADFAEIAKDHKRIEVEHATSMKEGGPDCDPFIEFWRDGMFVAGCGCRAINRDAMLQALHMGVPGYAADEVRCYVETFGTTPEWDKRHHRNPDPGELQRVFERGNPGGVVKEALHLFRCTRAGEMQSMSLLYELDRKTRELRWVGEHMVKTVRGTVPAAVRAAFDKPVDDPAAHGLDYRDFGITAEQARIHIDVATTQVMTYSGFLMALAARDEYAQNAMRYAAASSKTMEARLLNVETGEAEQLESATEHSFLDRLAPAMQKKLADQRKAIRHEEREVAHQNRAQRRAAARGRKRG